MGVSQDETQSAVPVLAYPVSCAISIVMLTAWGPIVVALTR